MPLKVAIVQGSKSDDALGSVVAEVLRDYEIGFDRHIISAHRTPDLLDDFCREAGGRYCVIIAIAGLSAALPGAIAARTNVPVIGVPADVGPLRGIDALLAMAQMPAGTPVATMGIGVSGAKNSAHLAARIVKMKR